MTKEALDALRYYLTRGEHGKQPRYGVVRALIDEGYISTFGTITEKGEQKLKDDERLKDEEKEAER